MSLFETKQTILNPEVAAVQYTLLLMDMSGSVTNSGQAPMLVDAASAFSERVGSPRGRGLRLRRRQGDRPIVASPPARWCRAASTAATYKPRDPSTNLNGAVIEGCRVVRARWRRASSRCVRHAGRVHRRYRPRAAGHARQAHEALDQTRIADRCLVIGVGAEIDAGELRAIGRDGTIVNKDRAQIATSFDAAAARVEAFSKRYYLLGYCSPARAGKHTVRIETTAVGRTARSITSSTRVALAPTAIRIGRLRSTSSVRSASRYT